MIMVRYAVCSERGRKPLTRGVFETREAAQAALDGWRRQDASEPGVTYWIAELGPECESWRWLVGADEPGNR